MKPILEIQNISKKYRIQHQAGGYLSLRERMLSSLKFQRDEVEDFWALKDVSFEVNAGESIGIIGRNGAGKSTLLKILSKITPPTNGRIVTRGRIASLLEVGTGFHPELTGRENIFFNGSLLGMKRKEIATKFDEIVDFSGVEKFLDTPLKHYSSGMQLRLAFAVAAFLEPEILIIDEVLAVGDAEFQKKCLGKMEDVSKSGRTILFVSHNVSAVQTLCSRGLFLDAGKVKTSGPVSSVVSAYHSNQHQLVNKVNFKRPHNSESWMCSFSFLDKEEPIFYYGDRIKFDISYESIKALTPYFGFVIHSPNGQKLINSNNRYLVSDNSLSNKIGTITCDLGLVPLMEGIYSISLFFGDSKSDTHILHESILFEVREKDFWGKGIRPPKNASDLWWPTQFQINN